MGESLVSVTGPLSDTTDQIQYKNANIYPSLHDPVGTSLAYPT